MIKRYKNRGVFLQKLAKMEAQDSIVYKPLCILKYTGPYGVLESLDAMRLPKQSVSDSFVDDNSCVCIGSKDTRLAKSLIKAGDDHAKAMRGIDIHIKLSFQVGFMIEFETYRYGVECLSTTSTMLGELRGLNGPELARQKQADLPDKIYVRRVKISYQALRRMYLARRNHRHPDWQVFCNFIEDLPYFNTLINPDEK